MATHPTFPAAELESVCRVLADTGNGLSGSEIGRLLAQQGIADPAPRFYKMETPVVGIEPATAEGRMRQPGGEFHPRSDEAGAVCGQN